jgi:peptidyl-prolyl cis-trans isomerase A (cyclophilin A)
MSSHGNRAFRFRLALAFFVGIITLLPAATVAQKAGNPVVIIDTSEGTITVELFQKKAPKSVDNFLAYVRSGFYKGTIFHRVIKGFMIQGGGFTPDMAKKPTQPPIPNEAANGLINSRGTLAMARTSDVNSATAQFFINTKDNAALDHRGNSPDAFGYAVFGKVTKGMEVVDKIESAATGPRGAYENVPLKAVVIKDVRDSE